jgi:hypothetical protein
MSIDMRNARLAGIMAEFDGPQKLLAAAKAVKKEGYERFDAFTPYPIEELNHVIAGEESRLPLMVFLGGLFGFIGGFSLQYWINVYAFPMNIGGRPLNSWPAFIVPTFEMTILFAGITAVLGMFALNGLPHPHHPVFNVDRFALATNDKFFLWIEVDDPQFELAKVRSFLEGLSSVAVSDVYDD